MATGNPESCAEWCGVKAPVVRPILFLTTNKILVINIGKRIIGGKEIMFEFSESNDHERKSREKIGKTGEIKEETDLSELGNQCLEYVETEEGKIVVKNVLLKFEEKICELQERILELEERPLCSLPISDCVNTLCLEDACNNTITTFGEWMNAVTVKICETP